MKIDIGNILFLFLAMLVVNILSVNYCSRVDTVVQYDTITTCKTDTIYIENFTTIKEFVKDTLYIYVCKRDTVVDSIPVPITETTHHYSDSIVEGDITIEGFRASLLSASFFVKSQTNVYQQSIFSKPKRFHFGVSAGAALTLTSQPSFVPYIGIGLTYSFISF